jgi:hypothetical protein
MNHKDIPIFLLKIPDNPVSMYYAGITYCSWTLSGYKVTLVDAVCPKTMHSQKFKLNQSEIRKKIAPFSEGELAAQYTHTKMFDMISESKKPAIVLEHDAVLVDDLPDLSNYVITTLHAIGLPGVAYYITPRAAYRLKKEMMHRDKPLTCNWDYYLWMTMLHYHSEEEIEKTRFIVDHYFDPEMGNTMEHPKFDFDTWKHNKNRVEKRLKNKFL